MLLIPYERWVALSSAPWLQFHNILTVMNIMLIKSREWCIESCWNLSWYISAAAGRSLYAENLCKKIKGKKVIMTLFILASNTDSQSSIRSCRTISRSDPGCVPDTTLYFLKTFFFFYFWSSLKGWLTPTLVSSKLKFCRGFTDDLMFW